MARARDSSLCARGQRPRGSSRRAGCPALLAGLAATALLGAAPSYAKAPLEPELVVRASVKPPSVSVAVQSLPGAACRLRISDTAWKRSFYDARVGISGTRSWHLGVPEGLNTAPWTFVATCRKGRQWGWHRLVAEMGFPSLGGALVEGVAPGSEPGTSCDEEGICFPEDRFEVGQCGWYGLGRRPDILPWVLGSQRSGEWLADASGHLPEGRTPRVGALAIWSVASDPPDGHVGYVADVAGSDVLIDDSNWRPTPQSPGLQIHEHWVPASQPTGYIYYG